MDRELVRSTIKWNVLFKDDESFEQSNVKINRKVLADLAMNHPETFSDIILK